MPPRIAVHHRPGSFSDRWIERARQLGCDVLPVDCLSSDIIARIRGCDALLWNWAHTVPADQLVARSVIRAAESMGVHTFPSSDTCWHFDDKLAQKYALEALGAPLARTYVFFDEDQALDWCETTAFPLVFKLRRGAGSANVKLVKTRRQARRLIARSFGRGFEVVAGYTNDAVMRVSRARSAQRLVLGLLRAPRTMGAIKRLRALLGAERGYAMFQDFLPGNRQDTRITVVGDRAFGFVRKVRPRDFRASGSGRISNDPEAIDLRFVRTAFELTSALKAQSLAFDFVLDCAGEPALLEVSYSYVAPVVHDCPGHWDGTLQWHPGNVWPQDAILDDVLAALAAAKRERPAHVS